MTDILDAQLQEWREEMERLKQRISLLSREQQQESDNAILLLLARLLEIGEPACDCTRIEFLWREITAGMDKLHIMASQALAHGRSADTIPPGSE